MGICWVTVKLYSAGPSAQHYRGCSGSVPSLLHPTKRLTPFPRKFTWQLEAGSDTETITEPGKSDDSEAQIPAIQSNVRASSGGSRVLTAEVMLGQQVTC